MLQNYLKIAIRTIWKHRLFSVINVFGLACGLMVCFLAIAHIRGVFEYDQFHPGGGRIYRILTDVINKDNNKATFATSPLPLAENLKEDYSFVAHTARIVRTYGEVSANEKKLDFLTFVVDPSFFKLFGYEILAGQAASRSGTCVITEATAVKIFGKANPIGQILEQDGGTPSVITGVIKDEKRRSHLRFDILFSVADDQMARLDADKDWKEYGVGYTYVLLKPEAKRTQLEQALPAISKRAIAGGTDLKYYTFRSQPLLEIAPAYEELMNSTYEPQIGGLLVEMGVGLLTLLMAGFNYINLTLARAMSRAREVGIRKTSGALRWQLLGQFIAESVILSLLASGLGYMMLEMVRPMPFVQQWLMGGIPWDGKLWLCVVLFSLLTGLLAGIVPARVLSSFQPAEVLRSSNGLKVIRGISLRKALIVGQFSVSLIAMIALVTMMRQQYYMATGDYGFRSKDVLNIPLNSMPYDRLANEVSKLAGVEHVSGIVQPFGHHGPTGRVKTAKGDSEGVMAFQFDTGADFLKTLDLTLVAGQDTEPVGNVDHLVFINEEAVRKFNLGDNHSAVGQLLWLDDSTQVRVAGVVKDFRFSSFAWQIKPLILRQQTDKIRYMQIAVNPGTGSHVLAEVKSAWKKLKPYEPFEAQWYDDFLYEHHSHMDDLSFMGLLLGISFSIACMGLLGMVTYQTQTRIKEVGVRKVMGAEVAQIIWLLSRDFVKLLSIAAAIALPLGYMAGYAFLFSFAYHVSIGFETLGLCFGILLALGSLIIGTKTYKAAISNPVEALANE